mgnify:FL=1
MKSKVLAALVATMAVGATCAFAANPFVDVPSDSWAYKSVVELADAGIIQGVDGEHFQASVTSLVTKPLKWLLKPWLTWTKLLSNSVPSSTNWLMNR